MAEKSKTGLKTAWGQPLPLGVTRTETGYNFAVSVPKGRECRLNLYSTETKELTESILLKEKHRTGNVFSVKIKGLNPEETDYRYQVGETEFLDPYAKILHGREDYGKRLSEEEKRQVRCGFLSSGFSWEDERVLPRSYSELIIYKINLRGFTRHPSSRVKKKGTFLGLLEKLPYLKELGINCVQLMPIYEYNEILEVKGMEDSFKINYWGYSGDNSYFAPKASYASDPARADLELKKMINTLHVNGIEVILEMNFTAAASPGLIQDCLRYWSQEYHIDGFKLIGDTVPHDLLAADPVLGRTKLLAPGWNADRIYEKDFEPEFKNLAECNDGYSMDVRRFLKADEEMVGAFASRIKQNSGKFGVINYITNHDGFTMMDLYSYDRKHNEANGENNKDGLIYNYSWNCGEEGSTRKKKVLDLRKKQIRNAFTLLLSSQGTPLLLAGDEFGQSQSGNSNAYCQDNETAWLNWNLLKTNEDILRFVKYLIRIRKEHPILHKDQPFRLMDYISCGFPDLSYHGTKAWYPDYAPYSRVLGIMLSGRYVKINRKENDWSFYIACNMHWEKHEFNLPKLAERMQWYVLVDTSDVSNIGGYGEMPGEMPDEMLSEMLPIEDQKQIEIPARTVVLLVGK